MDVRSQMRSATNYNANREAVAADAGGSPSTGPGNAACLANGLLALGLQPQDRVGVLGDSTLESADFTSGGGDRQPRGRADPSAQCGRARSIH